MKMSREGKQGSIAKRWSRRTRRNVEGRIEFRGVGWVFPVGGEPGARAKIACSTRKEAAIAGRARVERELLAETNEPNTTSELLIFCASCQPAFSFTLLRAYPSPFRLFTSRAHRSSIIIDARKMLGNTYD
jgi:hypothetical protein